MFLCMFVSGAFTAGHTDFESSRPPWTVCRAGEGLGEGGGDLLGVLGQETVAELQLFRRPTGSERRLAEVAQRKHAAGGGGAFDKRPLKGPASVFAERATR